VDVTREKHLTPRCKKFYKIVGDWSRRTAKLQRSVGSLRKRLKYAEKFANGPNFQNIVDCVNEPTYTFIMQQARLQKVRPRARRFKLDEKILSLALYKNSPKGYRSLSKIFSLPSPRTLTNMLNKIPYRPGINKQILNSLKTRVQDLKENEKICAVVFDEISIAPLLQYNSKEDYIDGVEDFGNDRTTRISNYANVFFIKGIYRQFKQPFSFCFSHGPIKAVKLKILIQEVITECQKIGLKVVTTICDQGSANQSAINLLMKATNQECVRAGVENCYFGFLVNGEEVVPLYDVPHLFKGIRNNLLNMKGSRKLQNGII
jgi:hypothetical protein